MLRVYWSSYIAVSELPLLVISSLILGAVLGCVLTPHQSSEVPVKSASEPVATPVAAVTLRSQYRTPTSAAVTTDPTMKEL
jgi:hypothetical protein